MTFLKHFMICFACLFVLVCLGTFDMDMALSWYALLIEAVLSAFYGWTKSINMNKIDPPNDAPEKPQHKQHHRPMPPHI